MHEFNGTSTDVSLQTGVWEEAYPELDIDAYYDTSEYRASQAAKESADLEKEISYLADLQIKKPWILAERFTVNPRFLDMYD